MIEAQSLTLCCP